MQCIKFNYASSATIQFVFAVSEAGDVGLSLHTVPFEQLSKLTN